MVQELTGKAGRPSRLPRVGLTKAAQEPAGTHRHGALAFEIAGPPQAKGASKAAAALATALGFPPVEREEIALAVAELTSNLIKHAGGGSLILAPLRCATHAGIEVISENRNPGAPDLEGALADGYSTAGTLGTGLGAVNRFMDSVEFEPRTGSGLCIVCRRWARSAAGSHSGDAIEFGAVTRPYCSGPENGDAFVIRQWEGHALAGVIDGLGHGPEAQRAAQSARYCSESHFDQPLVDLFHGVDRACRATRGVVLSLAQFDLVRQKIILAGIGNVEVRLLGNPAPLSSILRRGVLGIGNAPRPAPTEHEWTASSLLIMHSDGLQSRWQLDATRDLAWGRPIALAKRLLGRYGGATDDVTVLVARNRRAPQVGGASASPG